SPGVLKKDELALGIFYIDYGSFYEADETGKILGNFTAREYAFHISYARPIDSFFTVGINLKPVLSQLEKYQSFGLLSDIGFTYHSETQLLTVACVLKNIGYQLSSYDGKNHEPVPFEIQLGLTKKLAHAPFRFTFLVHDLETYDLRYEKEDDIQTDFFGVEQETTMLNKFTDNVLRHLNVGFEFVPLESFYAALSMNFQRRMELMIESRPWVSGISWGFGLKIKRIQFGYAYSYYHLAGSTGHLSLNINLDFLNKYI
ncbi:type IX secretion system protein PorQ, partial [Bacteroidota bacterium]